MKLFALLIGIDEYSPNSVLPIRELNACLNDVSSVQRFLLENYSDMVPDHSQILTLTNEHATRDGVINGFRSHLTQASKGDVALLYYSGHGSYGITAPEFQAGTTDKQEQTWVLYDSREPGQFDLADKEIALLLEEVSLNKPHVVVVADSCHSGSITREVEEFMQLQPRFTSGVNNPRPLKTYLNGAYLTRRDRDIPSSSHLLMAACERTERAWESNGEGQFTKALLSVLAKSGGQIWYSDLFVQVRASVKGRLKNQTPQLETIGGFSARQGFLGRNVDQGTLGRYRVHFNGKKWIIDLGVSTGIEPEPGSVIRVDLYAVVSGGITLSTATIISLNVTSSDLKPDHPDQLDKNTIYWGEPDKLPLSPFLMAADPKTFTLMKPTVEQAIESGISMVADLKSGRYWLTTENDAILIYDNSLNMLVQGVRGTGPDSVGAVLTIVQKLARWNRLLELKNNKSAIKDIDFTIQVSLQTETHEFREPLITLEHDGEDIPFQVILTNKSNQLLYVSLLYLSPKYGITVVFEDSQAIGKGSVTLLDRTFTLDEDEEIDTLKLILSTEPIDSQVFSQEELAIGEIIDPSVQSEGTSYRGIGGDKKSDWTTRTTTVRLVKKGKSVVGQQSISIGHGIVIEPHPAFRGNMNWASLIPSTRSLAESVIQNEYFAGNPYFEVVNFSAQSRDLDDRSVIEVVDIQQKDSLKAQPLLITIPLEQSDELILPFFFDGEDIVPAGVASVDEQKRMQVSVTYIPDETGDDKTRSLGGAIRMLFIKFSKKLGVNKEPQQLAWVNYEHDARRETINLSEMIKASRKVLLLIHGIIGDTEEMAKTFHMAHQKGYDLVLTYDYENLNTPIEENAKILLAKLRAEGFGPQDGRELVLVVHSMGGLVARYLIEQLGGDEFIDRLVMAGTPNKGSKFGSIPDYLNWSSMLLGMGTKIFPPQLGAVAGFVSTLLKAADNVLLPSLKQMDADSDFIRKLAESRQSTIAYHIVGGDLEAYLAGSQNLPLLEKAVSQIGGWVYKDSQNDIAVSTASIFSVPNAKTTCVSCHHLNYFTTKASVDLLAEAIG
ncbi:caspase family protein [Spirosoma pulveris]